MNDTIKRTAGEIGESIVLEFFEDTLCTSDWYDDKKDGMIYDMSYEVKMTRLNHCSRSFWIDSKQWPKCDGVDLLFFVKIPEKKSDGIVLYLSILGFPWFSMYFSTTSSPTEDTKKFFVKSSVLTYRHINRSKW